MMTKDLPESVAAAIKEINMHYDSFLDVMDLDMAMGQQMDTIFKSDVDRYKQALNIQSSDSEEDLGVEIQKKKKSWMNKDIAKKESKANKSKGQQKVTTLFKERISQERQSQTVFKNLNWDKEKKKGGQEEGKE